MGAARNDQYVLEAPRWYVISLVAVDRDLAGCGVDCAVDGRRADGVELREVVPEHEVHVPTLSGDAQVVPDRVLLVRGRNRRRVLGDSVG